MIGGLATTTQQVRRRTSTRNNAMEDSGTSNDHNGDPFHDRSGLVVSKMMKSNPQHHGYVMKLHVSTVYTILPRFFHRLFLNRFFVWFLSLFGGFLIPRWERRYLVILGGYLYKFVNDTTSTNPKGSPIPLESIEVRMVSIINGPNTTTIHDDDEGAVEVVKDRLPEGYTCIFSIRTVRKTQYYAVSNEEQALVWINSLRQARQESITRNMGHAPKDSYPTSWSYYDNLAERYVQKKQRIRDKMEQNTLREMEMTDLTGNSGGGPLPRGYYG